MAVEGVEADQDEGQLEEVDHLGGGECDQVDLGDILGCDQIGLGDLLGVIKVNSGLGEL